MHDRPTPHLPDALHPLARPVSGGGVRELPGRVLDEHMVQQKGALHGVRRLEVAPAPVNAQLLLKLLIAVHPEHARHAGDALVPPHLAASSRADAAAAFAPPELTVSVTQVPILAYRESGAEASEASVRLLLREPPSPRALFLAVRSPLGDREPHLPFGTGHPLLIRRHDHAWAGAKGAPRRPTEAMLHRRPQLRASPEPFRKLREEHVVRPRVSVEPSPQDCHDAARGDTRCQHTRCRDPSRDARPRAAGARWSHGQGDVYPRACAAPRPAADGPSHTLGPIKPRRHVGRRKTPA
mmetsp:Transcript_48462/g.116565  ORF Transcript_48462/g.116565 Transcript_48462/m.116565 type:complete len:296 (-) Transcript_48462:439-1326(-)